MHTVCPAFRVSHCFNPRFAPESEAIVLYIESDRAKRFQSALRSGERSDAWLSHECEQHNVSIRASLRRAKRWTFSRTTKLRRRFNPRFAPESEAIPAPRRLRASMASFNPRFAPESEAIGIAALTFHDVDVSIRASLRRAKRCRRRPCRRPFLMFQSALRSGERSDGKVSGSVSVPIGFNPRFAPESEAMSHNSSLCPSSMFQSALRSGERSDGRIRSPPARFRGFNPRFAPESEAIVARVGEWSSIRVSIRASLRRAKRSERRAREIVQQSFNPRFAPESEAILRQSEYGGGSMFQSALRSGERSDFARSTVPAEQQCFNPRFAPESEAIGRAGHVARVPIVSIRASLRRAKRYGRFAGSAGRIDVSIRASLRRAKRSRNPAVSDASRIVSIRASLRRAKRYAFIPGAGVELWFQSALRSGERSDSRPQCGPLTNKMFQSALRSGERSDLLLGYQSRWVKVSIRASLRRAKRFYGAGGNVQTMEFQSALRSGERSDTTPPSPPSRSMCFNPRFAPESEAMR